jgi:hypothetical protein
MYRWMEVMQPDSWIFFRRRLIASTRRFEKTPRHLKENTEAF